MKKYHVQDNSYHLKKDRKIKNGYVTYFEVAEYWLHARPHLQLHKYLSWSLLQLLLCSFN